MFGRFLSSFERWLVGGAFLATAALVCAQIVCRRVFSASIAFTEEIARYLLVWCTVLGAAAVAREGGHLGVVFLSRLLPRNWAKWVPLVGLCAMATLFTLIGVKGVGYVRAAFGETSQGMGLPIWAILHLAVPVGSFLIVARCLERAARLIMGREP